MIIGPTSISSISFFFENSLGMSLLALEDGDNEKRLLRDHYE